MFPPGCLKDYENHTDLGSNSSYFNFLPTPLALGKTPPLGFSCLLKLEKVMNAFKDYEEQRGNICEIS